MLRIHRVADRSAAAALDDRSLVGEQAFLQVTGSGFSLRYLPTERADWQRFAGQTPAADRPSICLLAEQDGAPVGFACVQVRSGWGELLDLRVDVAHRRQGIASLLLESCMHFVREQQLYGLCTETTDRNPTCCRLLQHLGFTLGGIDPMFLYPNPNERHKPLRQRACLLRFYWIDKTKADG